MFRSYDHPQAQLYASEINTTGTRSIFFFVSRINFQCTYFHLKIVVRPKYVAAKLNKIVKKNIEIQLRSHTRNRMQTPTIKII
jgi:hypothetical protein